MVAPGDSSESLTVATCDSMTSDLNVLKLAEVGYLLL